MGSMATRSPKRIMLGASSQEPSESLSSRNGPSQLIKQWINEEALSIAKKVESSPHTYPFINNYRYWPGPNSNTFAQWIAGEKVKLG